MRVHLYKLKKPCPSSFQDIEISEAIKEHVLLNRSFILPKKEDPRKTIQNIITYNNTMNNFINNMDTLEKLQKYLQYNNQRTIGFSEHIHDHLQNKVSELHENCEHVVLTKDDILELVDSISKTASKQMKEFNLMYDDKAKRMKLYDDGEWTDYLTPKGVRLVIKGIQEYYLEKYEYMLIRQIEDPNTRAYDRQHRHEFLQDYYTFIACFDVDPMVMDRKDRDILYDKFTREWSQCRSSSTTVADKYSMIYRDVKDKLALKDANNMRKHVCDILKQNTRYNIEKLNKTITHLFNIDEEFKELILKKGVAEEEDEEDWDLGDDD